MKLGSTIAIMGARLLFLVQLLLGIFIWVGHPLVPVQIHVTTGVVFILLVWFLGGVQATTKGGSFGLGLAAILTGAVVDVFGLLQERLLPGSAHITVQIVHVLLAVAAQGLAEMCAARYRRGLAGAVA